MSPITPHAAALIAAAAEAAFDPKYPLSPKPTWSDEWEYLGALIARNALFDTQRLGLGDPVYFGYVARHKHFGNYVVAIRGTEQPVEWAEDAETLFVPHPFGGLVEQGFWSIFRSMTFANQTVAAGIIALLHDSGANVTVIGHSLGAPLAAYVALDLAASLGAAHAGAINALMFASPKPGDGAFGHVFDTTLGHDNYAVFNYLRDVVPRLPISLPFGLGFQPLPNVKVLRPSASKTPIPDNIVSNHDARSYAALLQGTQPTVRSTT